MPPIDAHHAGAGTIGKPVQAFAQRRTIERLESEEERQQQHGREVRQAHQQHGEHEARDQPPPSRPDPHREIDQRGGAQHQHAAQRKSLDVIAEPARGGLTGQAIPVFQHVAGVEIECERDRLVKHRQDGQIENESESRRGGQRGRSVTDGGAAPVTSSMASRSALHATDAIDSRRLRRCIWRTCLRSSTRRPAVSRRPTRPARPCRTTSARRPRSRRWSC